MSANLINHVASIAFDQRGQMSKYVNEITSHYYEKLERVINVQYRNGSDNILTLHSFILHTLFDDAINGNDEILIRFDAESQSSNEELNEIIDFQDTETYPLKDSERISDIERKHPIRFSVLTKRICKYDEVSFETIRAIMEMSQSIGGKPAYEIVVENISYRPFFFEFVTDEYDFIKFMNLLDQKAAGRSEIGWLNDSVWYRATFKSDSDYPDSRETYKEYISLNGALEYSGSPFELKSGTLVFKTDVNNMMQRLDEKESAVIERIYQVAPSPLTKNRNTDQVVFERLGNIDITFCDIYSIGTANCIRLYGKDAATNKGKEILYDIGFRNSPTANQDYSYFINSAKYFKPDLVILSHWDSDHIFGCAYASSKIFACPWIAPDYMAANTELRLGAKRLSCYLSCLNKLILDRAANSKIAHVKGTNTTLEIWHSNSIPDNRISDQNRNGLILLIKHLSNGTRVKSLKRLLSLCEKDKLDLPKYEIKNIPYPGFKQGLLFYRETITILLSGDVPYSCFPKSPEFDVWNLRFLLIPHHCSKMNLDWLYGESYNFSHAKKCAISCTGLDNADYIDIENNATEPIEEPPNRKQNSSHPVKTDPKHIKKFRSLGFQIFPTGQVSEKFAIDFSNLSLMLVGRKPRKKNRNVYYF